MKKTGRIIISGDASGRGSFLRDLASNITELAFDYLDAPPVVVGSRNWIIPAHEIEDYFFPQPEWIIDAIHTKIIPLDGHICENDFTDAEQLDRNARGI